MITPPPILFQDNNRFSVSYEAKVKLRLTLE